jgi:hypothetical protein
MAGQSEVTVWLLNGDGPGAVLTASGPSSLP